MKYYIIFFDDSYKEVDETLYNQILEESSGSAIGKEINGSFYKFSDIRKILNQTDFYYQYPQYKPIDRAYSWNEIAGKGYEGIIKSATKTSHIEALARGLKKAKAKLEKEGHATKNIDSLLNLARKRYALIKK